MVFGGGDEPSAGEPQLFAVEAMNGEDGASEHEPEHEQQLSLPGVGDHPAAVLGRELDELREFPADAKHDSGVELHRVQAGLDPDPGRDR